MHIIFRILTIIMTIIFYDLFKGIMYDASTYMGSFFMDLIKAYYNYKGTPLYTNSMNVMLKMVRSHDHIVEMVNKTRESSGLLQPSLNEKISLSITLKRENSTTGFQIISSGNVLDVELITAITTTGQLNWNEDPMVTRWLITLPSPGGGISMSKLYSILVANWFIQTITSESPVSHQLTMEALDKKIYLSK